MTLENKFKTLCHNFSKETTLISQLWKEIETAHKQKHRHVRKEYAFYDDLTYFNGRKKVLSLFLDKEQIYKSQYFYNKYEKQARVNILIEYNSFN